MGGSRQTQTTQQTTNPYAAAQPLVNDVLARAQRYGNDTDLFRPEFGGTTMAGVQGLENLGRQPWMQHGVLANLLNGTQNGFNVANNVLTNTAGGGYMAGGGGGGGAMAAPGLMSGGQAMAAPGLMSTPDTAGGGGGGSSNPYLNSVLETARRKAADSVNQQFSGAGRYGSGAHTGVLADRLGGIETTARFEDYNNERTRQLQAAGLLHGAGMQGAQLAGQYDAANMGQNAALIQAGGMRDQMANAQRQAPLTATQWMQGIGFPGAQLGQTTNGTQTTQQPMNIPGMAIGGLATLGGVFGGAGPFGANGAFRGFFG